MATAGYSRTPLLKKPGITSHTKLLLLNAPNDHFNLIEANLADQLATAKEIPDLIHLFAIDKASFEKGMKQVLPFVKKNSSIVIWVSWYKKSSKKFKDLTEDIRNFALQNSLVDVKVCAVSDEWSGLKLVVPVSNR